MLLKGNRPELEQKATQVIADSINSLLKKQDKVVLAVPGGRSVSGIFKLLNKKDIQWDKVHLFMVDERMVPLDSPDSNFKQAKEALDVPNIHPFVSEIDNCKLSIENYEKELKKYGGHFDIVLLSTGEDGHVAGLFPNHSVLGDSEYFIEFHDSPKPPPDRMSASRKLLQRSKIVLLMFMGEGKRAAFERFNDPAIDIKDCPAKLVQSIDKNYIFTDLE